MSDLKTKTRAVLRERLESKSREDLVGEILLHRDHLWDARIEINRLLEELRHADAARLELAEGHGWLTHHKVPHGGDEPREWTISERINWALDAMRKIALASEELEAFRNEDDGQEVAGA